MLNLATKFLPVPCDFRQAWEAGFRSAELFTNAEVLDRADDVIAMARDFDMNYAMHFPNRPELSDDHLAACGRLFDELNMSAVVVHPPMMKRYGDRLRQMHPHLVLGVETMRVPPDEMIDWIHQQGTVTLDIEHIWKFTLLDSPLEDLLALVREIFHKAADNVVHVHMPGYLPGQGEHRPMYTSREFTLGVFDILADYDFGGLVVSEVDMQFQNPYDLKMDVLLFERWRHFRNQAAVRTPDNVLQTGIPG